MSETKIGLSQVNKPEPLKFRRMTNAIIMCFLPAITGVIQGVTMSDAKRNLWMVGVAAVPFLLKGVGMMLGDGQVYSPSNETMDKREEEGK